MPYETRTINFYSCDFCGQQISERFQQDFVFRFKRGQYNESYDIVGDNRRCQGHGLWICTICRETHTIADLIEWVDQKNGDNNE